MSTRTMSAVLACAIVCAAYAGVRAEEESGGWGSVDVTAAYVSKYMWRGFDLLEDHGAVQPEITVNLGETGFYLGVFRSFALDRDYDEADDWDISCGYAGSVWEKSAMQVDFDTSYTYLYYPNGEDADYQELALCFELPALMAWEPVSIVPYGEVDYAFEVANNDEEGWWGTVGLKAVAGVPAPEALEKEVPVEVYVEGGLNDGGGTAEVEKGWSHVAAGLRATVTWLGVSFEPSVNHQWTLEDTVNEDESEWWWTLSVSTSFPPGGEE